MSNTYETPPSESAPDTRPRVPFAVAPPAPHPDAGEAPAPMPEVEEPPPAQSVGASTKRGPRRRRPTSLIALASVAASVAAPFVVEWVPFAAPLGLLLGFQALTRIKQSGMRMRGRRLAILAILFGLVFNTVTYGPRVLAFFTDSETSTLEGLSIGQCFDSDQFEDVTADVDPREPVELSKCSEPHDVELFARPKLTEDEIRFTDANVDAVETREHARCSSEFRAYSGVDMQSSGLNLVALRTQEPIGARTAGVVDCWAVPVTGKLDYSARHILDNEPRFTEARSMHSLEVGQCFDSNQRSGSSGAFAELDLQTIKTCDEPHDAELIARIKLPPGAFPGIPYLHPSDEELCADAFGDYVGTPFLGSSLDMVVLTPTEETWDLGDDDIDCWVAPETGKKDFKAENARR